MLIPLRQAVIHSDFMARISVLPIGIPAPHGLHWSHGACNLQWGEASAEDLIFALLQTYALLTREAGIPAHRVHQALRVIPEYRATLLSDHPDALRPDEWQGLRLMMDIPSRLQIQIAD